MSEDFFSVSGLNAFIKDVLNSGFPKAVWVCGEIQELREKNNHLYFTLSEKDPDSHQVVAKIGVSIWATARPRIDAIIRKAENAFSLKEDIEVKLLCKVDFYPPFGQLRLIVESIDPVYTLGKIAQDKQRLIAALKAKGTLDLNKRLTLERVPLHIGLITSHDSAAYHDFTDELKRSGIAFRIFLVDSVMQGKNAEGSVVRAIKTLNRMPGIHLIVITRGGGSVTELSCFDSEKIAVAIAESKLPILSGIGHEINTTVTDLAAHTFLKTPTAVAQFLRGRIQEYLDHLEERQDQILELAKTKLNDERRRLKDWALTLRTGTLQLLTSQHRRMEALCEACKRAPASRLKDAKREVAGHQDLLKKTIHLHVQKSRDKINQYQKMIDLSDPKNILKRGFSITKDAQGKIIRSVKNAPKESIITTEVFDGAIVSQVKQTNA